MNNTLEKAKNVWGATLVGALFFALAFWSWKKWIDPVIDSGFAPYTAWSILQGSVLYRDLAYLYGPFTPYLDASLFRLFGVGLSTLFYFNLFLLATMCLCAYRFIAAATDRVTATICVLLLLTVFGFSISNYNFIGPYQQEITQSTAISFFLLLIGSRCLKNPSVYVCMPSVLFLAAIIVGTVPRIARIVPTVFFLLLAVSRLQSSAPLYRQKTFAVSSGRDLFYTLPPEKDPRVGAFGQILEIAKNRSGSLLVMPEGIMLNYLARKLIPSVFRT